MSFMAWTTCVFALFSRARSSTRLVPVRVLQNCPEAQAPLGLKSACATVSKAKSPGCTVCRSKWVCTGTGERNDAPAALVVLTPAVPEPAVPGQAAGLAVLHLS
jgi:hypothetical protein